MQTGLKAERIIALAVALLAACGSRGSGGRALDLEDLELELLQAPSLGKTAPRIDWSRPLGRGYAAFAADEDSLYTAYHEDGEDIVVALDPATGETVWEFAYEEPFPGDGYGPGPHSSPVLAGGRLLLTSGAGKVHCLEAASGELLWRIDLVAACGADIPNHGYAPTPLIVDDLAVLAVGGDEGRGVIAVELEGGVTRWTAGSIVLGYASPCLIELDGEAQVVVFAKDKLLALCPKDGRECWSVDNLHTPIDNVALAPLWGPDRILWSTVRGMRQGDGTRAFRLSRTGSETAVEEVYYDRRHRVEPYVNALRQEDFILSTVGTERTAKLTAMDVQTGRRLWSETGFEAANLVRVGDRILTLGEAGVLALIQASRDGVVVDWKLRIPTEKSWTRPFVHQGRIFVRDEEKLVALVGGLPF